MRKNVTTHFTLRVYATCPFSLTKISEPYNRAYEKEVYVCHQDKMCVLWTDVLCITEGSLGFSLLSSMSFLVRSLGPGREGLLAAVVTTQKLTTTTPSTRSKWINKRTDNQLLVELKGPKWVDIWNDTSILEWMIAAKHCDFVALIRSQQRDLSCHLLFQTVQCWFHSHHGAGECTQLPRFHHQKVLGWL